MVNESKAEDVSAVEIIINRYRNRAMTIRCNFESATDKHETALYLLVNSFIILFNKNKNEIKDTETFILGVLSKIQKETFKS